MTIALSVIFSFSYIIYKDYIDIWNGPLKYRNENPKLELQRFIIKNLVCFSFDYSDSNDIGLKRIRFKMVGVWTFNNNKARISSKYSRKGGGILNHDLENLVLRVAFYQLFSVLRVFYNDGQPGKDPEILLLLVLRTCDEKYEICGPVVQ